MGKYEPFVGDKIYAGLDFITVLIGTGLTFSVMPTLAAEAMKKAAENPKAGQQPSLEMMQTIMMGFMGCVTVVILAISILLWMFMIKGKNWAFIVSVVLIALGILMNIGGLAGAAAMSAMFGMAVGACKLVYCILRMIGKVGPKPT